MIVVMVVDAWDQPFNGTVVSSRRFAEALMARGVQVRVLAIRGRERELPGVELFEMPKLSVPGLNHVIDQMRVPVAFPNRDIIRKALEGASILHVQFPLFAAAVAVTEAKKQRIPVVSSFHLQPENILRNLKLPNVFFKRWIYGLMHRWIYLRSDHILAPSRFAKQLLEREMPVGVPVDVLSNGIPEHQLRAYRLRTSMPEQINVLCVGRLAREKRYDIVIDAVAKSAFRDRLRVTFVGSGPVASVLKRRSQARGINARFVAPSDNELEVLYQQADLFLHAGESELEGMSVMQAMAAGVPTIVSDSVDSAASTLMTQQIARFTFPNPSHLASQINLLCAPEGPVAVLSAAGHAAARGLKLENSVAQLASTYRALLDTQIRREEADRALA